MLTALERKIRIDEADQIRKMAISIVEGVEFPLSKDDQINYRITMSDFHEWRAKVVALLNSRLQAKA